MLDNFIFFFPTIVPKNFINYLSKTTQLKYKLKNTEQNSYVYDDFIFYYKEGIPISKSDKDLISDKFGYMNKKNYLKNNDIEVLLLGDSFIPELTKAMKTSSNKKIYNLGIGGQGIFHWKYHYKRFKKFTNNQKYPKIIILNFYEGNDIQDTIRAKKILKSGYKNSIYYPTNPYTKIDSYNKNFSLFGETKSVIKYIIVRFSLREKIEKSLSKIFNFNKNQLQYLQENKIFVKKNTYLNNPVFYNSTCTIRISPGESLAGADFSKNTSLIVLNDLMETFKILKSDNVKIIFNYVPSVYTIYHNKLKNDKFFKNSFSTYKNNTQKLTSFLKKNDIIFLDLTNELIEISNVKPLHPCNSRETHFSDEGYMIYAELINKYLKENIY